MKFIKNILISAAVILAAAYGLYFAGEQGWLENTPLAGIDHQQLNFLKQENMEQTKVLTDRAKQTGEHVQNVLGETVEVDEQAQEKPLHEKTIEYARYLYCKQVVEDWERDHPKTN